MLTLSKRSQLNNIEIKKYIPVSSHKYQTIVIGDPYCGKSTYLNQLVKYEKKQNRQVVEADDRSSFEFLIEKKDKRVCFIVNDTASKVILYLSKEHYII
jgi:GTPase SAR1 family protein